MAIFYGSAPEPKPDMQSQTNPELKIRPDVSQPETVQETFSSLSPAQLDRIFGEA